eukprot:6194956-Pleurochrysis_carterae.AAC.1
MQRAPSKMNSERSTGLATYLRYAWVLSRALRLASEEKRGGGRTGRKERRRGEGGATWRAERGEASSWSCDEGKKDGDSCTSFRNSMEGRARACGLCWRARRQRRRRDLGVKHFYTALSGRACDSASV